MFKVKYVDSIKCEVSETVSTTTLVRIALHAQCFKLLVKNITIKSKTIFSWKI